MQDYWAVLSKAGSFSVSIDTRVPCVNTMGYRTTLIVKRLPLKYLASWIIHFAGANASVREDCIYVAVPPELEKSDTVFDSYKETEGAWREALVSAMATYKVSTGLKEVAAINVIGMFSSMCSGVSVIMDLALFSDGKFLQALISIDANEMPAKDYLADILKQANMTYRLQGGVVYITTAERKTKIAPKKEAGSGQFQEKIYDASSNLCL